MKRTLLLWILLVGSSTVSLAQWQLIAGYDIAGFDSRNLNRFLEEFNQNYPGTTKAFKKMSVLHSIVIGARYQHNLGALELNYQRGLARRSANGIRLFDRGPGRGPVDLFYNTNTISTAMEWGRDLMIGLAVDYNSFKYEIVEEDNVLISDRDDEDHSWGGKLYLAWPLSQSNRLSFSLRPYYRWIWSDVDFTSVGFAPLDESIRCSPCTDRPHMFGLSVLIHNGKMAR